MAHLRADNIGVSYSFVERVWDREFPYVRCCRTKTFIPCTVCDTIKDKIKKAEHDVLKATWEKRLNGHQAQQWDQRKYFWGKCHNAHELPNESWVLHGGRLRQEQNKSSEGATRGTRSGRYYNHARSYTRAQHVA